ncbi:unnamed protein product [Heterosigma akashiwo]
MNKLLHQHQDKDSPPPAEEKPPEKRKAKSSFKQSPKVAPAGGKRISPRTRSK